MLTFLYSAPFDDHILVAMRIPPLTVPVSATSVLRSLPESAAKSPLDAAIALREFLLQGRATVILSGAGISVDSDIPDYRGTFTCLR